MKKQIKLIVAFVLAIMIIAAFSLSSMAAETSVDTQEVETELEPRRAAICVITATFTGQPCGYNYYSNSSVEIRFGPYSSIKSGSANGIYQMFAQNVDDLQYCITGGESPTGFASAWDTLMNHHHSTDNPNNINNFQFFRNYRDQGEGSYNPSAVYLLMSNRMSDAGVSLTYLQFFYNWYMTELEAYSYYLAF